jgi:carboxyl-terminal processing protease
VFFRDPVAIYDNALGFVHVLNFSRVVVAAALSVVLLGPSTLAPAALAQTDPGLDAIGAEYRDMLDLFYRPVVPNDLLQAGWSALSADAARHGATPPPPLPTLDSDGEAAYATFASAYATYVAGLPASFPASAAAADVQNGIADSVHEQHTRYLPPNIMRTLLTLVGGGQQSIGLGISLGSDPAGLITDVAPGGPADGAGLQPGDVIVAADGKNVNTSDTPSLAAVLAGAQGTSVTLSVDRGDGPRSVKLTRGPYYFPPLESRLLPGGVGYLRLSEFVISGTSLPNGTELLSDLDQRLDDLDAQGAQAWILDLRNNAGGSVQTADELLGRFLPDTVRSVRESDERGHLTYDLAAGRLHARQLPMAVLINGGSASASEVTAAALHEAHRAVLVGQRTAGAVASSELLPLPGGGGLQVAVAAAAPPNSNTTLDGVGIAPDVATAQGRTLQDYRAGRDPQLDAAVSALASAPPPPSVSVSPAAISPDDLDQLLGSTLPNGSDLPTNDRLTSAPRWQRLDYTHPNEVIDQNAGASDPLALQRTMLARGYQGTVMASYGSAPDELPTVSVNVDLYANADGAHAAATTNDLPQIQSATDAPVQLGDDTVAYRGAWLATGSTFLIWRRGRVVFTVTYTDVPGLDRPETLAAIGQLVDGRAQQLAISLQ